MGFSQGQELIAFKDILSEVSEEAILEYYTGITQIPCVTNSPLRVDIHPSFGFYYSTNGINFKDYAINIRGSLLDFLSLYLNLPFKKLKKRVKDDIEGIKQLDKYIIKPARYHYKNEEDSKPKSKMFTDLTVTKRKWTENDFQYWQQYGINKDWLTFGNIYPVSHIHINQNRLVAQQLAYCYVEFKDDIVTLKVYQPLSDRLKWLNNHNSSVWDLWVQAMNSKKYDRLIITSSRKDALCLWANTGIPSIALQSEGYLPKPHVMKILQDKFKTIYCLYDNDFDVPQNYGREYGKRFSEMYNLKQIEIPDEYLSKDPSDLYKQHGETIFKQVLKSILF